MPPTLSLACAKAFRAQHCQCDQRSAGSPHPHARHRIATTCAPDIMERWQNVQGSPNASEFGVTTNHGCFWLSDSIRRPLRVDELDIIDPITDVVE